jgi:hypothetical protein
MSISGFLVGLVACLWLIISILPFPVGWFNPVAWEIEPDVYYAFSFGWLNWVSISVGMLGLGFSFVGTIQGKRRRFGIAGIILCGSVILFGALRLL